MKRKNILVFPCGSEVALEIHRSLKFSAHVNLFGASSVEDHGKFLYENYINNIPFVTDSNFIAVMAKVVKKYQIDAIYPAMDSVIDTLKKFEEELGCKVISSDKRVTQICLSKSQTYKQLDNVINIPKVFKSLEDAEYPIFLKPDIGYGSRGVKKAQNQQEALLHLEKYPSSIILEYLPGPEYTVDCFTDFKGNLLFVGARKRKRVSNGISVNTSTMPEVPEITEIAKNINTVLNLNGAWFFQLKEREDGTLVIMEVASRIGGSSGVYRMKGVNFALLSVFNIFKIPILSFTNSYTVEMDRALDCKFKINIDYHYVYIDFDDVIIVDGKVNVLAISAIYNFINNNKKVYLITKHEYDIYSTLKKYRLSQLFDEVIHIQKNEKKWKFIKHTNSIFIDDSFVERKEVFDQLHIPVFSPDMLPGLV